MIRELRLYREKMDEVEDLVQERQGIRCLIRGMKVDH